MIGQKDTKTKGFTLIELLVVISVIGLLSAIILVALNSSRIKARNARRKSDAYTIRNALELYYDANSNTYPHNGTVGNPNNETSIQNLASFLVPTYLPSIPNDPKGTTNYQYVWKSGSTNFSEYGLLITFGADGGTDCKFRTQGGANNWFSNAPDCTY